MAEERPVLEVKDLSISFGKAGKYLHAVNRVSLRVNRGEIVGLIGQSGSGKTTLVMGILGLLRGSPGVWKGEAKLDGEPLLPPMEGFVSEKNGEINRRYIAFLRAQNRLLRGLRGRDVASIFQEPRAALDPYFKMGEHMLEALRRQNHGTEAELRAQAIELLKDVGLVDAEHLWGLYPHEISGGMAQRVMIAMALCAKPKLLVADEPSTALDVTTQAKLLTLFQKLRDKHGLSILLISHDIGVIQEVCKRVYVMHRGALVECGETADVLSKFRHPYTGSLVEAFLHFGENRESPPSEPEREVGCAYRPMCAAYARLTEGEKRRCESEKPKLQGSLDGAGTIREWARCHYPDASKALTALQAVIPEKSIPQNEQVPKPLMNPRVVEIENVRKRFVQGRKTFWGLDTISLHLGEGETYALVGESGSGKSTLALSMMILQSTDGGEINYKGEDLLKAGKSRIRVLRREIRMLFQHPEAVLNSGMTVQAILEEGLDREKDLSQDEVHRRVKEALEQVRLDIAHAKRFPSNLSSGEKQRVTIARALVTRPKLLVCDEPVASLDLAIQSQVMSLLREFQNRLGLTYLFISHNLELVKLLAHRIGVMYMGHLVEESTVENFTVDKAMHPYTRLLLASVPSMGDTRLRDICAEFPDVEPVRLEGGCPFRNRCPLYLKEKHRECETEMPPLRVMPGGARVACHMEK